MRSESCRALRGRGKEIPNTFRELRTEWVKWDPVGCAGCARYSKRRGRYLPAIRVVGRAFRQQRWYRGVSIVLCEIAQRTFCHLRA